MVAGREEGVTGRAMSQSRCYFHLLLPYNMQFDIELYCITSQCNGGIPNLETHKTTNYHLNAVTENQPPSLEIKTCQSAVNLHDCRFYQSDYWYPGKVRMLLMSRLGRLEFSLMWHDWLEAGSQTQCNNYLSRYLCPLSISHSHSSHSSQSMFAETTPAQFLPTFNDSVIFGEDTHL